MEGFDTTEWLEVETVRFVKEDLSVHITLKSGRRLGARADSQAEWSNLFCEAVDNLALEMAQIEA